MRCVEITQAFFASKDGGAVDIPFFTVFGSLTLVVAGTALAMAPPEKRLEFLLHITIVSALTVLVVKME